MRSRALERAIKLAGGPTKLAECLGISSQAISQWDEAPVERVLDIERAVDAEVTRYELRPDFYPTDLAPPKRAVKS